MNGIEQLISVAMICFTVLILAANGVDVVKTKRQIAREEVERASEWDCNRGQNDNH